MTSVEERILAALADHSIRTGIRNGMTNCRCGWAGTSPNAFRTHQSAMLTPLITAAWPCDCYGRPHTCITVGNDVDPCDHCRTQAAAAEASLRVRLAAVTDWLARQEAACAARYKVTSSTYDDAARDAYDLAGDRLRTALGEP